MREFFKNSVGKVIYHSQGYVRLVYGPEKRAVEELEVFVRQVSNLIKTSGLNKVLIDQRLMKEFSLSESQWIANFWLTQAQDLGLIYRATLPPKDVIARLAANNLLKASSAPYLINQAFEHEAEALAWLLKQP
ncbi:hypothetical protein [Solirubrum puertoriconensis]|uniref:STAS/SEC14 domain-containing protein n=1 Tax=Solirubrum puertoriconensis TaxID=1751427 RepID=A0A9X0HJA6_SOLP1|nr:hypothetical protein [Solirubrum puertoriconensis]KUG06916.1 hypothetical protein ASU33_06215 [Solirubrum puertoriconensis]